MVVSEGLGDDEDDEDEDGAVLDDDAVEDDGWSRMIVSSVS